MNETMPSKRFTSLVGRVAAAARVGTLVSEELYQEILGQIPTPRDDENNEAIALAVRHLGPFCDWREFGWANDHLGAGGHLDGLHLEIQRINTERGAFLRG